MTAIFTDQIMASVVLILAAEVVETAALLLSAISFTVILAAYFTTSISVMGIVFGPVIVVALIDEMRRQQPAG